MAARRPTWRPMTVPVHVRLAVCPDNNMLVQPRAWADAHAVAAQRVLAPWGVSLSFTVSSFAPAICDLLQREQRDSLATHAASDDGAVNVLIVRRIRDLEMLDYDLMGVHWRANSEPPRRWVYLTARAQPPVLAHELAHFFGVPHDRAGGNLMTPGPSSPAWRSETPPRPFMPRLTPEQASALRAGIRRWQGR